MSRFASPATVRRLALAAWVAAAPLPAQGLQAPQGAPVQPGFPQQAAPLAPPGLTPAQQEDKARLLVRARRASGGSEPTVASAQERMELWKMILIIDPADTEARLGYEQAQGDLDRARTQEEARRQAADAELKTQAAQAADRREKLALAERALYARDLNSAEQIVTGVLAQSPDDPRALSLRDAIRQAHEARRLTRRLLMAAGALVGLAAVILLLVKKLFGRKGGEGSSGGAETPAARGLVKVIDGVGRGRLMPVEKEVFRIGAADGERPEDKNDLVISDSGALISRYHCTILRKGKRYFLLDSSLNGTRLNGEPLERGEHHRLQDGDEFVMADASRLKFLVT
ncbi:MAG TPA: FHA domain-containing protein [Longimicrobiaceae bacterium]|nr:FHA domain-containing protein [Longimicrobiaceae bacterium]